MFSKYLLLSTLGTVLRTEDMKRTREPQTLLSQNVQSLRELKI